MNIYVVKGVKVNMLTATCSYRPEVFIYKCFHSVGTKTKIHKLPITPGGEILIECIIETFVQIIQVQKNHRLSNIHASLDSVYVMVHLHHYDDEIL